MEKFKLKKIALVVGPVVLLVALAFGSQIFLTKEVPQNKVVVEVVEDVEVEEPPYEEQFEIVDADDLDEMDSFDEVVEDPKPTGPNYADETITVTKDTYVAPTLVPTESPESTKAVVKTEPTKTPVPTPTIKPTPTKAVVKATPTKKIEPTKIPTKVPTKSSEPKGGDTKIVDGIEYRYSGLSKKWNVKGADATTTDNNKDFDGNPGKSIAK